MSACLIDNDERERLYVKQVGTGCEGAGRTDDDAFLADGVTDIAQIFPACKSLGQQAVAEARVTGILIAYAQEFVSIVSKHTTYLIDCPVGVCREQYGCA